MLQLATATDREGVNAIAGQVHAMHVAWRPDIYETVEEQYTEDRFTQAIQSREIYVAKLAGTVVGYAVLKKQHFDWPGIVERTVMTIDEFGVHEACHRQGIGTAMMEDIHALARAFGCSDLQLKVYPQNDDAVGFYQKCGFAIQNIGMQKKL